MRRQRRAWMAAAVLAVALVSCGKGGSSTSAGASSTTGGGKSSVDCFPNAGKGASALVAEVASYDLAVGPPARFIVGLLTPDQKLVAFGSVQLRFGFLGAGSGGCHPTQPASAGFLPIPGTPVPSPVPTVPQISSSAGGEGVYGADAGFDRAGNWEVEATASISGKTLTGTAAFQVFDHHQVPAPGDQALATQNLTTTSTGVPPSAIDSRAESAASIPDPELHATTIAAALAAHRPVVAVFATPVYCVSRFCGPVTDMVDSLAKQYGDRAAFVHVEIWHDYNQHQINKAAADWLYRNNDLEEPWVFVIGADGKITARFDNVTTRDELEPLIQALPAQPR